MKIIYTIIVVAALGAISYVVFPLIFLVGAIATMDTKTYAYTDFQCRGETFSIQSEQELSEFNSLHNYETRAYDAGKPLKVYPIGSSFKILRVYTEANFESGTISDILVQDEEGYKAYIYTRNIDPRTCQIDYAYKSDNEYMERNASSRILKKDDNLTINTPPLTGRDTQNEKDKDFIASIFNNNDTQKPNLTLGISSSKYFHYTRKIIEKNLEHFKKYDLILADDGSVLPIFQVDEYRFTPFSCETDGSNMYECYGEDFHKWLDEPYETTLPLPISTPEEIYRDIKNDEKFPLVFYMSDFNFLEYSYMLEGIKKLNEDSNFSIPSSIGDKRFLIVGGRVISPKTEDKREKRFYISTGINVVARDGSKLEKYFPIDPRLREHLSEFSFAKACSDNIFKYDSVESAMNQGKDLFIVFTKRKGCYAIERIVKENFPKDLSRYNVVQLHEYTEEYNKYIKYFEVEDFVYNYVVVSDDQLNKIDGDDIGFSSQNRKRIRSIAP